jgi:hypothetical protein
MVDAVPARACHFDGSAALAAARISVPAPADALTGGGNVDGEGFAAVGVGVVVVGVPVEPIRAITKRQLPANPHTATTATTTVISFFMLRHAAQRRSPISPRTGMVRASHFTARGRGTSCRTPARSS